MLLFAIGVGSLVAGVVQTVTGFGAGIVLMLFLPYLFEVLTAASLSASVTLALPILIAWKYRHAIRWRKVLPQIAVYQVCSLISIRVSGSLDLRTLSLIFGVFLMVLSFYLFILSKRLELKENFQTAVVCSVISGVCSGLFSIGGPLMALYYLSVTEDRDSYLAQLQTLFAVTGVINLAARMMNGIYTSALLPYTLLGIVGICTGMYLGLRLATRLNADIFRKLVNVSIGVCGVATVIQQLTLN